MVAILFPLGGVAYWLGHDVGHPACEAAPLAAPLFFGGTLFPVMGFFNLYTFRYSLWPTITSTWRAWGSLRYSPQA